MTPAPRPPSPAPALFKPQPIALILLALATCLLWARQPSRRATFAAAPVPRELGLWAGKPLTVDDRTRDILETDDVALMEYHLGKEPPVWFAQVAGFGNRAAFHPPELCYVGSHFEVLEREPITVLAHGRTHRVMRLVIGQGDQRFEAWYWFTAGGRLTPNYYEQQVWLLADAIRRRPMSGTLVRISTPLNDARTTRRRLLAFLTSWDSPHNTGTSHGS